MRFRPALWAPALGLIGLLPAPLSAQRVPPSVVAAGTLSFDAHATAGDFTGVTDSVSGGMAGGDSLGAVQGCVEAPVRSLTTRNDHRDRDMNKSMESGKYPVIRFRLAGVEPGVLAGDSTGVTLHGELTLHGVTQTVALPGSLVVAGDTLRLRSDFPVNVKDYRVGGLSKLLGILKMDEHITVHVKLDFVPGPGSADCPTPPASDQPAG